MKKFLSLLLCAAIVLSCALAFSSCKKETAEVAKTDAKNIEIAASPEITSELKNMFDKTGSLGVAIKPVAYIGAQNQSDTTEHCVLCRLSLTDLEEHGFYGVVDIYKDSSGNCSINSGEGRYAKPDIVFSKSAGGWSEPNSPELTPQAAKAFKALNKEDYQPLALIATQVVSGKNYCVLCKVSPQNSEPYFSLLTVYEDLSGKVKMTDENKFDLKDSDIVENVKSFDSLSPAQNAVGFKFALPEELTLQGAHIIDKEVLDADFEGGYARKAKSAYDISGNSELYSNVEQKTAGDVKVTLKGEKGKYNLAVWTSGEYSYCLCFEEGISEKQMLKYVSEIK